MMSKNGNFSLLFDLITSATRTSGAAVKTNDETHAKRPHKLTGPLDSRRE